MSGEQKINLGDGDTEARLVLSGYTEQEAGQIALAVRALPKELLDNPKLLFTLMERAALELRRDREISVEGSIPTRAKENNHP